MSAHLLETERSWRFEIVADGTTISTNALHYAHPGISGTAVNSWSASGRYLRADEQLISPTRFPINLPGLVVFSRIGALYYHYTPFPWMVETPSDITVALKAIVSLSFPVAGIYGVKVSITGVGTVGRLVGFLLVVALYAVDTVNCDTTMRHRNMILWAIFLFDGVGIAQRFRFVGLPN